ncbi:SDR family NAD(P)-dependent oxidoreductase [Sphingobium algorifonticola]|nr:SDR family NAD(P)-dependent oxidoreductase [Sphingobium algorifonticola]
MGNSVVIGASSGIGRALAEALAAQGHVVQAGSRSPSTWAAPSIGWQPVNITSLPSIDAFAKATLARFARIDMLVVSAGAYTAGAIEETSIDEGKAQFDTYVFGTIAVIQAFLPKLREQRSGKIIIMASSAADAAIPFHGFYSASKAAIASFAECLAHEMAPFNIDVITVLTTGVRTSASSKSIRSAARLPVYDGSRDRAIAAFIEDQDSGMEPADLAQMILKRAQGSGGPHIIRIGALAKILPYMKLVLPSRLFLKNVRRSFE